MSFVANDKDEEISPEKEEFVPRRSLEIAPFSQQN